MTPFENFSGVAIPFGRKDVDTDLILPGRYLKVMTRLGLGRAAFETLRFGPDGRELETSLFHHPRYRAAPILIAGENFGCGSSREHAVWALGDLGVRAIIAPSFGDIFAGNSSRNGLLLIELPQAEVDRLMALAPDYPVSVALDKQTVAAAGEVFRFEIDAFQKQTLASGLDEIGMTEEYEAAIARHEAGIAERAPWLAHPPGGVA